MINQQLIDYIKKTKELGQTDEQIKTALINAGWSEQIIDEALGIVETSPEITPIAPQEISPIPGTVGIQTTKKIINKKVLLIIIIILGLLFLGGGAFYYYQNWQKINALKQPEVSQQKEEATTLNNNISSLVQKIKTEKNPEKYKEYIYQLIKFENEGVETLKEIIKTTDDELLIEDILEILIEEKIMAENEAMEFLIKTRPDFILEGADEMIRETRDAQRISDLNTLKSTINLYLATAKRPLFNGCVVGKIYSSDKKTKAVDGTGWLPLDFTKISGGSPLAELSIDPQNNEEFIYKFACDPQNLTFEFNAQFESSKYKKMMSDDKGNNSNAYEAGTDLNLIY